jgi:hypothetical protein
MDTLATRFNVSAKKHQRPVILGLGPSIQSAAARQEITAVSARPAARLATGFSGQARE